MKRTKVDFANSCADARKHKGKAQSVGNDRAVMFVQSDQHEFYMYFDSHRWHECRTIHDAWAIHQITC